MGEKKNENSCRGLHRTTIVQNKWWGGKEKATILLVFYKQQSAYSEVSKVCDIPRFSPGELSGAPMGEQS